MVVSDFAFVNNKGRNILVIAASTDNEVVLVDFKNNFRTRKLNLSPSATESTGGSSRQIEWAVGTDNVWINGFESKEVYVVEIPSDIDSAKISRTLQEVNSNKLIFAYNYERLRAVELMDRRIEDSPIRSKSSTDSLAAAGTAIGCVSLVVGLIAVFAAFNIVQKSSAVTNPSKVERFQDEENGDNDTDTIGSKVVN